MDIDGVVADVRHRLRHVERRPKDWDAFFAAAERDPPHPEGIAVVSTLAADHDVVYVTGRPEHLRAVTERWLEANGIGGHRLVMRTARDRSPAAHLKVQIVRRLETEAPIGVVVDDDTEVLAAMEAAGFATFAATWERRAIEEDAALAEAQETEGRT